MPRLPAFPKGSFMKKIWKFISSMRFAIALLLILALACAASSLITQNQTYAWYSQRYSERTAALIMALRLDDAFHSPWFIAITAFLCVNLLLCNLLRLPQLIRRTKVETRPEL
jgi:cytochrome c biogenesis protein